MPPHAHRFIFGLFLAVQLAGSGCDRDLEDRRQAVIEALWGRQGLPRDDRHEVVERFAFDEELQDVTRAIDVLDFDADLGLKSRSHHFMSVRPKQRLLIYHYGHHGTFLADRRNIRRFLEAGYDVMGFDMPMIGLNKGEVSFTLPSGETRTVRKHKELYRIERAGLDPMRIFLSPLCRGINYGLARYDYRSVDMTGISGGGWTTHIYSAVDVRIRRSYPVAGGLPHDIRRKKADHGDYEQFSTRRIFSAAGFIEMLALGAAGPGRAQIQVLNQFDSCCFKTDRREHEMLQYESVVAELVRRDGRGGSFRIFMDNSHKSHKISPEAMEVILADLAQADGEVFDAGLPLPLSKR